MRLLAIGPEGVLFTEDKKLYLAWPSTATEPFKWVGMEVDDVEDAFIGTYGLCGAEVDMRQNDTDEMTPEIMDLGNRIAEALKANLQSIEVQAAQKWRKVKSE